MSDTALAVAKSNDCPVCGAALAEHSVPANGYVFVACGRCGHRTRFGPPAPPYSVPEEARYLRWKWVYLLLRIYDYFRVGRYRKVIRSHASPSLLDVGAGPLLTARTATRMGVPYLGIEPNPVWQNYIPPSIARVIRGTLADVPDDDFRQANVILLFHVVEHFDDPVAMLNLILDRCADDAHLILRTPDAGSVGAILWGKTWFPLCPDEHPGLFSRQSLLRTLLNTGRLHVERIASADAFGDTFLTSHHAFKRVVPNAALRMAVTTILSPLFIAADVSVGLTAMALKRTHEFEAVVRKRLDTAPFLSFVIPAYNEKLRIVLAIGSITRSIAAAGIPAHLVEIVVVDDSSTDGTGALAESLGARVVRVAHRHIAATRNSGGKAARGQYLAFMDADCEVAEDFVAEFLKATARVWPDTAGVRLTVNRDGGNVSGWGGTMFMSLLRNVVVSAFSVFIMRREVFEKYGGFDERVYAYEDVHWLVRFKILGYVGKLKCYRVFSNLRVTVSSRAARRKGAMWSYLKHMLFPWMRYDKDRCRYWYNDRPSD